MKLSEYQALVTFTAALLPTYLLRFTLAGIPTNLFEIAVGILVLAGLIAKQPRKQLIKSTKEIPKTLVILINLFLLAAIISTIISPHATTSLGILKSWIIIPIIFSWIVLASKPKPRQVVKALIASGVIVALFGVSQIGTLERIKSIYDVPNSLALFLAPLTVLALLSKQKTYWPAAIMFLAIILTQSLMGIISVALIAVIGILTQKKWLQKEIVIIIGLAIIALPIIATKTQYLVSSNSSAAVRLQLWDISLDLIQEKPLLGIGLGTFEPAYQTKLHQRFLLPKTDNSKPIPEFVFRDPHNWILSFYLNTGLLGLIAFVGLNIWALRRAPKPVQLALTALLLFGLTDTIYWKNDLAALHLTLIALVVQRSNKFSTASESLDQPTPS